MKNFGISWLDVRPSFGEISSQVYGKVDSVEVFFGAVIVFVLEVPWRLKGFGGCGEVV
jgi:hypothetical protein